MPAGLLRARLLAFLRPDDQVILDGLDPFDTLGDVGSPGNLIRIVDESTQLDDSLVRLDLDLERLDSRVLYEGGFDLGRDDLVIDISPL